MKGTLLVVLALLTTALQAQIRRIDTVNAPLPYKPLNTGEPRLFSYSVGLRLLAVEELPKILNQTDEHTFYRPALSGAYLKINDNQISFRLSGTIFNDDISFKNECEDCEEASGKLKDISASIGFEKNFVYGRVQPYFAFDLGYRRNEFDGQVKDASTVKYTEPYNVRTLKNGLQMAPNFGLKFGLLNHLHLVAETGIGIVYNYEKQNRQYENVARTRTFSEYRKWEFLLRPLSQLSLQYSFGLDY